MKETGAPSFEILGASTTKITVGEKEVVVLNAIILLIADEIQSRFSADQRRMIDVKCTFS